jgi:hypothetical protein
MAMVAAATMHRLAVSSSTAFFGARGREKQQKLFNHFFRELKTVLKIVYNVTAGRCTRPLTIRDSILLVFASDILK